ncbi:hypothetical protein PR048_023647 [Dryococelus australis]|uniref:Uncharacterized protein n=1 Tax=Dryococelus australis TaxID=614101 RepID=A0ABQ9GUS0_9NEOP|nr:hypothetical protein PR048_023647 [Dryococelus australis]
MFSGRQGENYVSATKRKQCFATKRNNVLVTEKKQCSRAAKKKTLFTLPGLIVPVQRPTRRLHFVKIQHIDVNCIYQRVFPTSDRCYEVNRPCNNGSGGGRAAVAARQTAQSEDLGRNSAANRHAAPGCAAEDLGASPAMSGESLSYDAELEKDGFKETIGYGGSQAETTKMRGTQSVSTARRQHVIWCPTLSVLLFGVALSHQCSCCKMFGATQRHLLGPNAALAVWLVAPSLLLGLTHDLWRDVMYIYKLLFNIITMLNETLVVPVHPLPNTLCKECCRLPVEPCSHSVLQFIIGVEVPSSRPLFLTPGKGGSHSVPGLSYKADNQTLPIENLPEVVGLPQHYAVWHCHEARQHPNSLRNVAQYAAALMVVPGSMKSISSTLARDDQLAPPEVDSVCWRRFREIPTLVERPGGERQPAMVVLWRGTGQTTCLVSEGDGLRTSVVELAGMCGRVRFGLKIWPMVAVILVLREYEVRDECACNITDMLCLRFGVTAERSADFRHVWYLSMPTHPYLSVLHNLSRKTENECENSRLEDGRLSPPQLVPYPNSSCESDSEKDTHQKRSQPKKTTAPISVEKYYKGSMPPAEIVKIRVCKAFFLSTLSISQKPVYNAHMFKSSIKIPQCDRREKYTVDTISKERKEKVRNHIKSFPYYCKADSKQCDLCEEFLLAKKESRVSNILQEKYEDHLKQKQLMPIERQYNTDLSRPNVFVCFDIENFNLPHCNVSVAIYKRKHTAYNMTAQVSVSKLGYCGLWTEALIGRSGNDIASAVIQLLERIIQNQPETEEIITWSDSYVPQNHNFLISLGLYDFFTASSRY